MTSRELHIGDVFHVAGQTRQWRKVGATTFHPVGWDKRWDEAVPSFVDKELELVSRVGEIGRSGNLLILRGGAVTLGHIGNWKVLAHTPGDPLTEFVLTGGSFGASESRVPTAETAIAFAVQSGAKELGRSKGSEVFAYGGRVYARATKHDIRGQRGSGGYKRMRIIDGKGRLIIDGLLTLPGEPALYDIIMEHFGPDTIPR